MNRVPEKSGGWGEMENITYDKEADVLNIDLEDKEYWKSIELPNGMVVDIAKDGNIISIEKNF